MQNLQLTPAAPRRAIVPALVVFGVALGLFLVIAVAMTRSEAMHAVDSGIEMWLHMRAMPTLTGVMVVVSFLGAPTSVAVFAVAGSLLLVCRRRYAGAAILSMVVLGGNFLNFGLKHLVQRGRPVFDDPMFSLPSYSFPSGHAMASTVFYGLLAMQASSAFPRRVSAGIASGGALAMVALVCFSRMYLGLHYLSDVTGGIAEGIGWLALSTAVLRYLGRDEAGTGSAPSS